MKNTENPNNLSVFRVVIKGFCLFLIINFIFIGLNQLPLGKISLYNLIFPGRERFPFGENPALSFNITLNNIDAMFSSMKIDRQNKKVNEFRVFFVGDSSVWGSLLSNSDSLTGQINRLDLKTCDGLKVEAYNLGYPTLSVLKDLFIIDKSLTYKPDLIVWMVTLESFPMKTQLKTPFVANNPIEIENLLNKFSLENNYQKDIAEINYWDRTLIGQRRNIADLLRLQFYGILWSATGIDQNLNDSFTPAKRDFDRDFTFQGQGEHTLSESELSFNVLEKANEKINVPIVVINEPILISGGKNSDVRYNFYYPRWAYDQYRLIAQGVMTKNQILYYDLYNLIPEDQFTNSAIHLNKSGEAILAQTIGDILSDKNCQNG
jgi:hypothetical protein